MGIVGGISILGTTGIVEPMSSKALADSIKVEISVLSAEGNDSILIYLGNFGRKFATEELDLNPNPGIMCSNFVDVALDSSVEFGFKRILLIGHIGKLVKLGIGMFNTHSHNGDGRIETLLSCALEAGADDFSIEDEVIEIVCGPNDVSAVSEALTNMGYKVVSAEAEKVPSNYTKLEDEEAIRKMNLLLDTLEDNDDVQNVYHNWEMPEE